MSYLCWGWAKWKYCLQADSLLKRSRNSELPIWEDNLVLSLLQVSDTADAAFMT